MWAAHEGHEACVQALLRAKANTELLSLGGRNALAWVPSLLAQRPKFQLQLLV